MKNAIDALPPLREARQMRSALTRIQSLAAEADAAGLAQTAAAARDLLQLLEGVEGAEHADGSPGPGRPRRGPGGRGASLPAEQQALVEGALAHLRHTSEQEIKDAILWGAPAAAAPEAKSGRLDERDEEAAACASARDAGDEPVEAAGETPREEFGAWDGMAAGSGESDALPGVPHEEFDTARGQDLDALLSQDRETLGEFAAEAREHLVELERELLDLERDATSDVLQSSFRRFHTLKGLAGIVRTQVTRDLSHEVETLLDQARNGQREISSGDVDVMLGVVDYWLQLVDRCEAIIQAGTPEPMPPAGQLLERIRGRVRSRSRRDRPEAPGEGKSETRPAGGQRASSTIKLDPKKLDRVADIVGELIIAQSLIRHDADFASLRKSRLGEKFSQLSRLTNALQEAAMSLRVVPVRQLFQRLQRLVRDIAKETGKEVEVETRGEDTELDRTMVEMLFDPLMHMVRNSVDHGLEPPDQREERGKPRAGRLVLEAYHQGGSVVVAVHDDGRGLDADRILAKGVERGLVEAGAELPPARVYELIFEPGFSTAAQVTDLSGRGVGMDVVRKQIQRLRGKIEIETKPGEGTAFLLKLPVTLAIIEGLVVRVGEERYIVPLFSLLETFRPRASGVFTMQNRTEVARVRDQLLPLIRLEQVLGVPSSAPSLEESVVVVAESQGRRCCLLVDQLLGNQEVVIKSLGDGLKGIRWFSGGAILGDGSIGLILDVEGILAGAA